MNKIDIIVPSYQSKDLTITCIKSFERYKGLYKFKYIVIENSNNCSYKDDVIEQAENVVWIQNYCPEYTYMSSDTNAIALEVGLKYVTSKLVFICHNDVVACHPMWMNFLHSKIKEGNSIAGTVLDPSRINAVHISGLLTYTSLAKSVSMFPKYKNGSRSATETHGKSEQVFDVGDEMTQYCRDTGLKYFCCRNTFIQPELIDIIKEEKYAKFNVDRALDDYNNVIFMHLGRGTLKTAGTYYKTNRVMLNEWLSLNY